MHDFSSRSGEFRTRRGKWRFDDDEPTSVKRARRRALPPIEAAFPGVVKNGVLDRQALGARVFGNKEALRRLEAIVSGILVVIWSHGSW